MPIRQHEPIESGSGLTSEPKRQRRAKPWAGKALRQPRAAALQHAMNTTPRPTAPSESVAHGYMNSNKFHDREPGLARQAMEKLDPSFFDTFPRKGPDSPMSSQAKDAARALYRHGLAACGKPALRSEPGEGGSQPLPGL